MEARYLRVKNWGQKQHYDPLKRRPPWVKLYNTILEPGEEFMELPEQDQWQLVRIWLVASRSERLTVEPDSGKLVPVVAFDEQSLRRSTMSLKKLPLERFIRSGWLVPVAEEELWHQPVEVPPAAEAASTVASAHASAAASKVTTDPGLSEAPPRARARRVEVLEDLDSGSYDPGEVSPPPSTELVVIDGNEVVTTRTLVAEFVDGWRTLGTEPERSVVGHLSKQIKKLLDDGQSPDAVRAGLRRMVERKFIQPSLLANFVMEAQLPSRPAVVQRFGRGVSTEQILDMAARAAAEEREAS